MNSFISVDDLRDPQIDSKAAQSVSITPRQSFGRG
jgi:hypothetical protein